MFTVVGHVGAVSEGEREGEREKEREGGEREGEEIGGEGRTFQGTMILNILIFGRRRGALGLLHPSKEQGKGEYRKKAKLTSCIHSYVPLTTKIDLGHKGHDLN